MAEQEPPTPQQQSSERQAPKFFPFTSCIDPSFWMELYRIKLEEMRLETRPLPINGYYRHDQAPGLPPFVHFDSESFLSTRINNSSKESHLMNGTLIVTNTKEEFQNLQVNELLRKEGVKIWQDQIIEKSSAAASENPLGRFLLLVYGDLKRYKFHYWFAFPAICYPTKIFLEKSSKLDQIWSAEQIAQLTTAYNKSTATSQPAYFAVKISDNELSIIDLNQYIQNFSQQNSDKYILAFADPCTDKTYPGWPLRNLIALISQRLSAADKNLENLQLRVLSFRQRLNSAAHSLLFDLSIDLDGSTSAGECPEIVGWEKNNKNLLAPRHVDLSGTLDPHKRAASAIDLNLKLMKWRLVPGLDLAKISATKCLLFGAGTLGCAVARNLLGWGVRHITLLDSGRVSDSNPVRQCLFEFADVGKPKAEAAAAALRRIFPQVQAAGHSISIPMPGHSVGSKQLADVQDTISMLTKLVEESDVLFLLTDTRESRWLPTLVGAVHRKGVINAALGFDTYLVQRHGMKLSTTATATETPISSLESNPETAIAGPSGSAASGSSQHLTAAARQRARSRSPIRAENLGCYFCNDVVAPGDSSRDRTLDQQCTVTRPGVSGLAASLAVELAVSLLQHPAGFSAPALTSRTSSNNSDDQDSGPDQEESLLGLVPHQIRGFLSRWHSVLPTAAAFDKCTACSDTVLHAYTAGGWDFLLKVFNDSTFLDELTGLRALRDDVNLDEVWELSDDETCGSRTSMLSTST